MTGLGEPLPAGPQLDAVHGNQKPALLSCSRENSVDSSSDGRQLLWSCGGLLAATSKSYSNKVDWFKKFNLTQTSSFKGIC